VLRDQLLNLLLCPRRLSHEGDASSRFGAHSRLRLRLRLLLRHALLLRQVLSEAEQREPGARVHRHRVLHLAPVAEEREARNVLRDQLLNLLLCP